MGHGEIFSAARIPVGEQVKITTMYLLGDAKLWWHTESNDEAVVGQLKIKAWEVLKKELKDQFLPTNTVRMDRESLKKVKQTSSIEDDVKDFSSLILTSRTCLKSTSCLT